MILDKFKQRSGTDKLTEDEKKEFDRELGKGRFGYLVKRQEFFE